MTRRFSIFGKLSFLNAALLYRYPAPPTSANSLVSIIFLVLGSALCTLRSVQMKIIGTGVTTLFSSFLGVFNYCSFLSSSLVRKNIKL